MKTCVQVFDKTTRDDQLQLVQSFNIELENLKTRQREIYQA